MRLAKKVPMDEYTLKMKQELETRIEDITYVHSAQVDTRALIVDIIYVHPDEERKDDFGIDDVDISAFKSALKFSKYFNYVWISG